MNTRKFLATLRRSIIASSEGIFPLGLIEPTNIPIIPSSLRMSSEELTEEYDKARLDDKDSEVLKGFQILDSSIEEVESFSIG